MSNPVSPPDPQEGHEVSFGAGPVGRLLFWIAVVFSVFQIVTAAHLVDLSSQITRAVHVGFLMVLAFPLNALIFQPIFRALDARAERIQGARDHSSQLEEEANNVLEQYESAIRDARVDAEANRQAELTAAREEQSTMTAQARSDAEAELARARTEMTRSLAEARATLRESAEDLATAAAEQVLGRTLS